MKKIAPRNWWLVFTPAIIVIIVSVIGVIASYAQMDETGGWSFVGVMLLVPVIAILLFVDLLARLLIKQNTLLIWIIELVVLAGVYYCWLARFV